MLVEGESRPSIPAILTPKDEFVNELQKRGELTEAQCARYIDIIDRMTSFEKKQLIYLDPFTLVLFKTAYFENRVALCVKLASILYPTPDLLRIINNPEIIRAFYEAVEESTFYCWVQTQDRDTGDTGLECALINGFTESYKEILTCLGTQRKIDLFLLDENIYAQDRLPLDSILLKGNLEAFSYAFSLLSDEQKLAFIDIPGKGLNRYFLDTLTYGKSSLPFILDWLSERMTPEKISSIHVALFDHLIASTTSFPDAAWYGDATKQEIREGVFKQIDPETICDRLETHYSKMGTWLFMSLLKFIPEERRNALFENEAFLAHLVNKTKESALKGDSSHLQSLLQQLPQGLFEKVVKEHSLLSSFCNAAKEELFDLISGRLSQEVLNSIVQTDAWQFDPPFSPNGNSIFLKLVKMGFPISDFRLSEMVRTGCWEGIIAAVADRPLIERTVIEYACYFKSNKISQGLELLEARASEIGPEELTQPLLNSTYFSFTRIFNYCKPIIAPYFNSGRATIEEKLKALPLFPPETIRELSQGLVIEDEMVTIDEGRNFLIHAMDVILKDCVVPLHLNKFEAHARGYYSHYVVQFLDQLSFANVAAMMQNVEFRGRLMLFAPFMNDEQLRVFFAFISPEEFMENLKIGGNLSLYLSVATWEQRRAFFNTLSFKEVKEGTDPIMACGQIKLHLEQLARIEEACFKGVSQEDKEALLAQIGERDDAFVLDRISQLRAQSNALMGKYEALIEPDEQSVPDELIDPVTQEMMSDPMTLSCEHTFDFQTLSDMIDQNLTNCALCRAPMQDDDLKKDLKAPFTLENAKINAVLKSQIVARGGGSIQAAASEEVSSPAEPAEAPARDEERDLLVRRLLGDDEEFNRIMFGQLGVGRFMQLRAGNGEALPRDVAAIPVVAAIVAEDVAVRQREAALRAQLEALDNEENDGDEDSDEDESPLGERIGAINAQIAALANQEDSDDDNLPAGWEENFAARLVAGMAGGDNFPAGWRERFAAEIAASLAGGGAHASSSEDELSDEDDEMRAEIAAPQVANAHQHGVDPRIRGLRDRLNALQALFFEADPEDRPLIEQQSNALYAQLAEVRAEVERERLLNPQARWEQSFQERLDEGVRDELGLPVGWRDGFAAQLAADLADGGERPPEGARQRFAAQLAADYAQIASLRVGQRFAAELEADFAQIAALRAGRYGRPE